MTLLTADELKNLFRTVYKPRASDKVMTIIADVPDAAVPDSSDWRERRELAYDHDEVREVTSMRGASNSARDTSDPSYPLLKGLRA